MKAHHDRPKLTAYRFSRKLLGMTYEKEMLDAALEYASNGWRVHPLTAKRPYLKDWPNKATTNAKTIRNWWKKWPNANIGVLTGNDGLIVIDTDQKNGRDGERTLLDLERSLGELPETRVIKTPHGRHRYFDHPRIPIPNSAGKIGDGIDIKSDRGYVVAPPSVVDGREYSVEVDGPVAQLPEAWVSYLKAAAASSSIVIEEGTRNSAIFSEACKLRSRNYPFEESVKLLMEFNTNRCPSPLTENEVLACLRSAYRYRVAYELNDLGNAQRLLDAAENRIIFVPEIGSFFLYDGFRWVEDVHALTTMAMLKRSNRHMAIEAAQVADEAVRKRMAAFATQSQNTSKLKSAIENAQSEPDVAVSLSHLDADPLLLGVQNGVVDLRNGKFRKSRKRDLITKTCGCEYVQGADCPRWMELLRQIFDDDHELTIYAQRLIGYCLTGLTGEHLLFAILGPGASGKSTFLETIAAVLGEYSANIQTDSLMAGPRRAGGASEDIARLVGIRFLTTTETTEGSRFNQALIKDFTGGDRMTARFLYKGSFEYVPHFKLLIRGNHRPRFDGEDSGMARRIRLLPFYHPIPPSDRDKDLLRKPRAELPGILNWAIDGCLQWLSHGLGEPRAVVHATTDYILAMDILGQCLSDRFQQVDGHVTPFARIYAVYEVWCQENGHAAKPMATVAASLSARGFEKSRRRIAGTPTNVRLGLRIRPRRIVRREQREQRKSENYSDQVS